MTKEKVLNAPLIEDGTLLLYASKVRIVCDNIVGNA